ncbi:helix-turn-helix transcriptional regulator [Streptomyces sp. NBC_01808]|uniref:winged helix-turn-helix transcriptional regulator n=1 Tax=Streptomyces sp. NBC_01808 TaxID=2975947 RepID=UPI002DDC4721|nr:helix-turn-helix domain-containing protein [Streptomyces sp. NBC_01808]WSA38062.1 helix-turn-helix transcriptional regulator [Streptomyces sp. NBC_01808]
MAHQTETDGADRETRDEETWDEELAPTPAGRTCRPEPDCPVEIALDAVAGRWTTLVLRELMGGPHSFGALRAGLPQISPKVLTERLAALRDRGLVLQERFPGFPVRTRYTLTPAGRALRPLLVELYRTGAELTRLRD